MGGISGEEIVGGGGGVIVDYRLKNGLCHGCGARIYDLSSGRVSPLTIEGVVVAGRCLFCYPDTATEEKKETPKDKGKRKADKTPSSSVNKKSFRCRLRSSDHPEHPPAARPFIKEEAVDEDNNSIQRDISTDTSVARLPQKPTKSEEEEDNNSSDDDEQQAAKRNNGHTRKRKSSAPSLDISIADIDENIYHGTVTKGDTQNGSGSFRFVYPTGPYKGKDSTYEGEFKNGLMEGHGTSVDAVGCVYTGEFHKGAAHGYGKCSWSGDWRYEGEWKMDEREGHGKLWQDVEDGEVYEGEWKDDQWHGKGELRFSVGGKYVGGFKHHQLDGEGRVCCCSCCRQRCACICKKSSRISPVFHQPLFSMSSQTAACTRVRSRANTGWVTELWPTQRV
jgi:hypothetical protein